jgi:hypothetical protein
MNQVGETKTFALSVTPPADSGVYSYVWKFWDGTVAVTATPRVEKTLNIGGDPNDSRKLYFTCQPVMEDGQSVVITGFVIVNNPPYVIPSPEITRNDDFFPYSTAIRLTAYDVEGDSLSFLYYNSGDVPLGGGVTTNVGPVNGTWNGTAASYTGFQNVFDGTISADSRIVLKIVDSQSGTRLVNFDFFGETPPAPVIGVTADADVLTTDASSVPDQRIGPNQQVSFTVYASDPVSSNFDFLWSFFGSNGWAVNSFATGTSAPTADGSVRNTYTKDISAESGGQKTVLVAVKNTNSNKEVQIPIYVNLIANTVASTCTFTVKDENGNDVAPGATVPVGTILTYAATAVDPQNDVLVYKWTFAQPGGTPATLRLWGREATIDTTGFTPGGTIVVSVLTTDRMNGQATFTGPSILVS